MAQKVEGVCLDHEIVFEEDVLLQGCPLDKYLTEIGNEESSSYLKRHTGISTKNDSVTHKTLQSASDSDDDQELQDPREVHQRRNESFQSGSIMQCVIDLFDRGRAKMNSLTSGVNDIFGLDAVERAFTFNAMQEVYFVLHSVDLTNSLNTDIEINHKLQVSRLFFILKTDTVLTFIKKLKHWKRPTYFWPLIMVFIAIICPLLWGLLFIWFPKITVQDHPIMVTLFCAVLYCISLIIYKILKLKETIVITDHVISKADQFKNGFTSFNALVDKALLMVREAEIISMGYTHYHPSVPLSILNIRHNQRGQCPMLRKSLLDVLFESFKDFKNVTLQIVNYLPREVKEKYEVDGILTISIDSVEVILKESHDVEKNNIPVDLLKSLICLSRAQQTEFIQILISHVHNWSMSKESGDVISLFMEMLFDLDKIISYVCDIITSHTQELTLKYNFTKDHLFEENSSIMDRVKFIRTSSLPPFMNRVNSTMLHLQSALERINSLQEIVTNYHNGKALDETTTQEYLTQCEIIISGFKANANGAISCISDIEEEIKKSCKASTPPDNSILVKTDNISKETSCQRSQQYASIQWDEKLDGDVMIEGYSDPVDFDVTHEDAYSIVENERLKKEQRESRRLMSELKAIFSLKKDPVGLLTFDLVKEGTANMEHKTEHSEFVTETPLTSEIDEKTTSCAFSKKNTKGVHATDFQNSYNSTVENEFVIQVKDETHEFLPAKFGLTFDDKPDKNTMAMLASAAASHCRTFGIAEQTLEMDAIGTGIESEQESE